MKKLVKVGTKLNSFLVFGIIRAVEKKKSKFIAK